MKKFILSFFSIPIFLFSSPSPLSNPVQDVVVIGGGIGGLTSALYLSRGGLHPLVIAGPIPGGALTESSTVENWPGDLSITGTALTEKIKKQIEASGAIYETADVTAVDFSVYPYRITLSDPFSPSQEKKIVETKACIIATGAVPKELQVPGEKKYWLKGIHSCAVCDGGLYRGKHVVVVGGGDSAITEASYLSTIAEKVILVVRSSSLKSIENARKNKLLSKDNVEIFYNTTVKEIIGDDHVVTNIILVDHKTNKERSVDIDGLFLAIGAKPNTELFQNKLEVDADGYIVTHKGFETSQPLVYAIGDVVDKEYKQAITAAGDAAKAALECMKKLGETLFANESRPNIRTKVIPPLDQIEVIAIRTLRQFEKEVLDNKKTPVIVDFYADWCGPCKALEPHIKNWSKHFGGKIKFVKINLDQLGELAERYNVRAVPTVLYFDEKGSLLQSSTGLTEIQKLFAKLNEEYPQLKNQ